MCIRRYCFLWLLLLLAVLPSPLTAQTNVPSLYKDVASDLEIPTEEKLLKDDPDPVVLSAQIAVRLKKIQKTIPLDYNEHVQTYITYNTKRKTHISKMLGRAQKFFPIFESILSQHGVPEEMKYLAVVESALCAAAERRCHPHTDAASSSRHLHPPPAAVPCGRSRQRGTAQG
mgnify:CR=1 FL=1